MGLYERITEDIKEAMKAKDKAKLEALRAIKSQLMLARTAEGGGNIDETQEIKILQKMVKQRKDSAEIYRQQGRTDLYEKEMQEVKYIEPYLPEQMSEAELENVLKQIIERVGASSMKDMGKVMGVATKELAGKADGKTISQKVKQLLG